MKYNRAIYLLFTAGTNQATAVINVPIQVKRIHCKALGYTTGTAPNAGTAKYGFLVSDLTQNTPLAMFYQDSTYPYSTAEDIDYELPNPQPIQGTYTFTLLGLDGLPLNATANNDRIGLILEFNDENEPPH